AKVVGAMAYPIFLAVVGCIVLNVLIIFFVPQFEPVFAKLKDKGELPALTSLLMATSHFMQSWGWLFAIFLVLLFMGIRRLASTDKGRLFLDGMRLKLPQAGTIYLHLAISRFTRILGTMLHNGIPILQALRIAKDSTGNRVLAIAIDNAADNITGGKTLA